VTNPSRFRPESAFGVLLAVGCGIWRFAAGSPPAPTELWQLVAYTGVALLAIGLVRDLYIKFFMKAEAPKRAGEKLICLESLIGSLLVAAGLGLLGLGVTRPFETEAATLGVFLGGLFVVSDFMKDVVVVFRREKDHLNLIPW
jgi:hypothetical protein